MHPRNLGALALAAVLTLSACSSDDPEPKVAPTPSASVTATPTSPPSSGNGEPLAPQELSRSDAAGAKAFVEYYWDLVDFAQASGDVDALASVSLPSCEACEGGMASIEKTYDQGGSIEGGEATVRELSAKPVQRGDDVVFEVQVRVVTTRQQVRVPGKKPSTYPPGDTRLQFIVEQVDGAWKVGRWDAVPA